MDNSIAQLISWLKEASPQLWSILMKQVYIEAYTNLIIGILLLIIVVVSIFKLLPYINTKKDNSIYDLLIVLYGIGIFVFSLIVIICLLSAYYSFMNPEYQAIMLILDKVK